MYKAHTSVDFSVAPLNVVEIMFFNSEFGHKISKCFGDIFNNC